VTDIEARILRRLDEMGEHSELPRHVQRAQHRAIAGVVAEELERMQRQAIVNMKQISSFVAMPCECWSSFECGRCRSLREYEWKDR
jgi:hypothetical protein